MREITLYEDKEAGEYWRGVYLAKNGDTLQSVAQHFKCSVVELVAQNIELCTAGEKTVLKEDDVLHGPAKANRKA